MEGPRGKIAWLYALGLLAAAQLGKMSALVPLLFLTVQVLKPKIA